MSTTSFTGLVSSTVPSPSPSATRASTQQSNNPSTFYKNLFYILIGILCAFGFVSFLSLLRARRRRTAVLREAERLGVLVPGIPGYVRAADRARINTWARADGTLITPDWWDVERDDEKGGEVPVPVSVATSYDPALGYASFQPLGVIPPTKEQVHEPIPSSHLPYFPNHLAYRPESLLPPVAQYDPNDENALAALGGEHVDVVTIIQMPREPWPMGREVTEEEEVTKEWSGIHLGVLKMDVARSR